MSEHLVSGRITFTDASGQPSQCGTIHAQLSGRVFQSLPVLLADGHSPRPPGPTAEPHRHIAITTRDVDMSSLNGDLTLRITWDGDDAAETLGISIELTTVTAGQPHHTMTSRLQLTSHGGPVHTATVCLTRPAADAPRQGAQQI